MSVDSDGGDPVESIKKRKRTLPLPTQSRGMENNKTYVKPLYKRLFSENHSTDCVVYVASTEDEKIGNKNPTYLTKLFTENVKGIVGVHRLNAYKIGMTFKKPAPANNFLKMDDFLSKYKLKAFIPAHMTEKTGVIRFVPIDMTNEEIYKNISCDTEVISIKRFMKKVDGKLIPLGTVAVTFAGTSLPQYAYIQLFRYKVHTYIPPLVQCYKCLKFNHSAKVCRGEQMCSSCAGQHSYKDCDSDSLVCINCGGHHLAISRDCPVKQKKMEEKKNKFLNQSYATVITYSDLRGLIRDKCGIQNIIVDNLVGEGNTKKVTVGLADEGDAAILVRKINGLYLGNLQLYVEDVRKKKASEQPYRNTAQEGQGLHNRNQFDNYLEIGLNQPGFRNETSDYGNQLSDYGHLGSGFSKQNDNYGNRQGSYGDSQPNYANPRSDIGNQLSGYGNKRSELGNHWSDNVIQRSEYGNQHSEYGNQRSENRNQQSGYINQHSDNSNQRIEYYEDRSADGIRSSDFGNRQSDNGNKRADFVNQQGRNQSEAVTMSQQPYYVAFGQSLAQKPKEMAFSGQTSMPSLLALPVPSPYEEISYPPIKGGNISRSSKNMLPVWDSSLPRAPESKWNDINVRSQNQYESEHNQYGSSQPFDTKKYGGAGASRSDHSSHQKNVRWEYDDRRGFGGDNRRTPSPNTHGWRERKEQNFGQSEKNIGFGNQGNNMSQNPRFKISPKSSRDLSNFTNSPNKKQTTGIKRKLDDNSFGLAKRSNLNQASSPSQAYRLNKGPSGNKFGGPANTSTRFSEPGRFKPQSSAFKNTTQYGVSKIDSFNTRNNKVSKESTPNAPQGSKFKPAPVNFSPKNVPQSSMPLIQYPLKKYQEKRGPPKNIPQSSKPLTQYQEKRGPSTNVPQSSKPLKQYQEKRDPPKNKSQFLEPPSQYQAKKKKVRSKKRPLDRQDDHSDPTIKKKVRVVSLISRDQTWRSQASSDLAKEIIKKWCRIEENAIHILRQLKNCIKSRIDILLGERFAVPVPEIIDLYRQKFKREEDEHFYKAVVEKVDAEGVKDKFVSPQDKELLDKLKAAAANAATAGPAKAKPAPPKPSKSYSPVASMLQAATGKVPKYPNANKSNFKLQKKINQLEMTGKQTYALDPPEQKALDEQLTSMSNLIKEEFANLDEAHKEICKNAKDALAEQFVKTLNLHLSKRILDIRTNLNIIIYGSPKLPKKEDLVRFLQHYGVVSLKKSDRKKMYMCCVDSYENYDKLCLTESSIIGDMTVTFKPLYIAGPPVKLTRDDYRQFRGEIVKSQLDKINKMIKGNENESNVTNTVKKGTNEESQNLSEKDNEVENITSQELLENAAMIDKHVLENNEEVSELSKVGTGNINNVIKNPNDAMVDDINTENVAKQRNENEDQLITQEDVQITNKDGQITKKDVTLNTEKDVNKTLETDKNKDKASDKKELKNNESEEQINTKGMTDVDNWGENDDLEGWDLPSGDQLVLDEVVEDDDLEDY